MKKPITSTDLKQVLEYRCGSLFWRKSAKGVKRSDFRAGSIRNTGYEAIRINGIIYQSHVLVWLYFNDEYIPGQIDHINGIRNDNRIENLRKCNPSQNSMNRGSQSNNKSGVSGVLYRKDTGKWTAYIGKGKVTLNGKIIKSGRKYLGCFSKKEDAVKARKDAENEIFGEWARS